MGGWKNSPSPYSAQDAADKQWSKEKNAAHYESIGNRPNQYSPIGSIEWQRTLIDPTTGQVYDPDVQQWDNSKRAYSNDYYKSNPSIKEQGYSWDPHSDRWRYQNPDYIDPDDLVFEYEQHYNLNPEYQRWMDNMRMQSNREMVFRNQALRDWSGPGMGIPTVGSIGGGQVSPTTGTNDWRQFGSTANTINTGDWREFGIDGPNVGADDWREFAIRNPTTSEDGWREFAISNPNISADDWRQFGDFTNTIGADDWREFGTTDPTLDRDSYDERFGDPYAYRDEFGDHDMGGGDWDYINYQPDYIRQQAYDYQFNSDKDRLDERFASDLNALQIQMRSQGLQPGDQQWRSRMAAFEDSRNDAYEDARQQAMAASRSEAAMLWDQQMAASEQKNRYHQADIDNAYRARQGNIANYLQGHRDDAQNYLNYMNSAYDQDLRSRQQQLDAQLGYGREAWQQDYANRQAQIAAQHQYANTEWNQQYQKALSDRQSNLAYENQAFLQDYQKQQADRQANLDYSREAWDQQYRKSVADRTSNLQYGSEAYNQDFARREAQRNALLNYGNQAFNQQLSSRQQELDAEAARQQLMNQRYQIVDPGATAQNVANVLGAG